MATVKMAIARYTWPVGIVRLCIETVVLPDIAALIVAKKRAKVVILIPLPVDPGADPTNEINIINMMVAK